MDLTSKIRYELKPQLTRLTTAGRLAGRKNMQLVPFVGNGLSRIALARQSQHGEASFYAIVGELCKELGLPPLDHLTARGFLLDEVYRLVLQEGGDKTRRNTINKIWELFSAIVPSVEKGLPSPLHIVLAKSAKAFITTNYDLLIERTLQAKGIEKYQQKNCIAVPMNKGNGMPFGAWDSNSQFPSIYKIHGSFMRLPDNTDPFNPLSDGLFNDVQDRASNMDTFVASAEIYDWWAYECTNEVFEAKFKGPIDILKNNGNLILVIGHGLRAEERIIFRLLQTAMPTTGMDPCSVVLPLVFAYEQDVPGHRIPQIISPINLSPGLVGTSLKRELAHLVLIDELHQSEVVKLDADTYNYLQEAIKDYPSLLVQPDKTIATMSPMVVSVGQIALHTNKGLEAAPSQERAYSPALASWSPGKAESRPLEVSAPMGDALVPCYVWEGLGIPYSLVGQVACDSAGRTILDYLGSEMEYGDFSQIKQDSDPGKTTEQATVACWMDLRLIMDGIRNFGYPVDIDKALPPSNQGRIIYASKPALKSIVNSLENQRQDLLIFDTGNNCMASEFELATSRKSVVIASALSLYLYINSLDYIAKHPNHAIDDAWKSARNEYFAQEPKDETGRYKQMSLLLDMLDKSKFDLSKTPLGDHLNEVQALACTLGPVGTLWWSKDTYKPIWTRVVSKNPPNPSDVSGQCLPFREIRNALGCGDVSRGGYLSSLVAIYYPQLGCDDQQSKPRLQPNLVVFSIRAR